MRHRKVTLGIAIAVLAACGGDSGSGESGFCDKFRAAGEDLTDLAANSPDDLNSRLEELDDIEPPDQIADTYQDLVAAYQAIADTGSLTDPAVAAHLSEAQTNLTEIETYIEENCDTD